MVEDVSHASKSHGSKPSAVVSFDEWAICHLFLHGSLLADRLKLDILMDGCDVRIPSSSPRSRMPADFEKCASLFDLFLSDLMDLKRLPFLKMSLTKMRMP